MLTMLCKIVSLLLMMKLEVYMDEQLEVMVEQIGSMDKVVKYYNKKNVEDFKTYFFDIIKMNKLDQLE